MRKTHVLLAAVVLVTVLLLHATGVSAQKDTQLYDQLVNIQHPIQPYNYVPPDLIEPGVAALYTPAHTETELRIVAAEQLARLFYAAGTAGIHLVLASGYRSYLEQTALYTTNSNATIGLKEVAPPGQSEHQTGLAVDIVTDDHICAAQVCFVITKAADWLQKNAPSYGFILRYPDNKTDSTDYPYEPWHFRYVGAALAQTLTNSGQTLEEYYK